MSNSNNQNNFGMVYMDLLRKLYKLKLFSQAMFTIYISSRANVEDWQYNESDIRINTGIHRKIVRANCDALVAANIFSDDGVTQNGSRRYKLDRERFDAYLKSGAPLSVKSAKTEAQGISFSGRASLNDTVTQCEGAISPSAREGISLSDSLPCHSVIANKEYKKEEREKEDTHTRGGVCVCHFHSLAFDANEVNTAPAIEASGRNSGLSEVNPANDVPKASETFNSQVDHSALFFRQVKELQRSRPELGITVSSSASRVSDFFANRQTLTAEQAFKLFEASVSSARFLLTTEQFNEQGVPEPIYVKSSNPGDAYETRFYTVRAPNLNFFLKHYDNIAAEMSEEMHLLGGEI